MSVDRAETRVAILEDDVTVEVRIERRGQRSVVGHVWRGRVTNVLAGMEAAFVDVGIEKNGFLHVDEVMAKGVPKNKRRIAELLKKGDEIMVQATKDPMGSKGCRLTMQLSLAGRFVVYVPYGSGVGVSKRLTEDERRRLRQICDALPLKGGGLIVRTAAAGASAEDIARDIASLNKLWQVLQQREGQVSTPSLLYSEADISLRTMRDLLNAKVDEVLVDDEDQHERLLRFLRKTSPAMAERVRLYTDEQPMMRRYGVEKAILSTLERRAPLPGGGSLVIDDTEAMTVIDVNSGRNVGRGKNRLEDTVTQTNLEAANEVVRQLRLRDIGGIVIIDFIDMDESRNRKAVKEALDKALERDRTRTFVVDISPLGLVEMTRQNIAEGPREILTEPCITCGGAGSLVTGETAAIEVERQLIRTLPGKGGEAFSVTVGNEVADLLSGEDGERLADIERETGKRIVIERDPNAELDEHEIRAIDAATAV